MFATLVPSTFERQPVPEAWKHCTPQRNASEKKVLTLPDSSGLSEWAGGAGVYHWFGCLRMSPAYLHLSTSFIFPKACRKPLFSYFLPLSYFLPCALSTWETEVVAFCRTLHSPAPSGADEWRDDQDEEEIFLFWFHSIKIGFKYNYCPRLRYLS